MAEQPFSETTQHWQSSHFEPLKLPRELVARIRYRITYQTARSSLRGWCGSYTLTESCLEAHDVVFDTSQYYEGQVVSPSRTYPARALTGASLPLTRAWAALPPTVEAKLPREAKAAGHPKVILWRGSALIIPITEPLREASELSGKTEGTEEAKPAKQDQPPGPGNGE